MDDLISRQAALDTLDMVRNLQTYELIEGNYMILIDKAEVQTELMMLPSAEPEWNNHTVACLLAEMFGDDCACNFNGIDEWLPEKCEMIDSCPHPVGVTCWEQFLMHRSERRTDE